MAERDRLFHPVTGCLVAITFMVLVGAAIKNTQIHSHERSERQIETQGAAEQRDRQAAIEAPAGSEQRPSDSGSRIGGDEATSQPSEQSKDQFFWLGDTLAQWAMAIFSLGALFVSVWAVLVVRGTLKAALAANRGFKESAERQLRSYVSYDSMRMLELHNHSRHFQIAWKNTGQTPTKRLRTKWGWWCDTKLPPDEDFDFPDKYPSESAAAGGVGNAGAGGTFFSNGPVLTSEQFNAVMRGELKVLYWAWVDYSDVFPDTPRRRTEACYKLVIVPGEEQVQVGWIGWGRFNGTDEECLKSPQKD